jgi:hypothetical protein
MGREKSQFKPGNKMAVGHGRPAFPPEIRAARRKNQAALIQLLTRHFAMTDEQAQQERAGPNTTRLEMAVDRLIERVTKDGDAFAFKMMIDIMCGSFPEEDTEEFSQEDLEILQRVKELKEQKKIAHAGRSD